MSTKPILNAPGPKHSAAFNAFLGGLAADWDKLPPSRKLDLHYKFRELQEKSNVSRADAVRAELTVQKGSDPANWSAAERARLSLAHKQDGTVQQPVQPEPPSVRQARARRNELLSEKAKIPYRSANGVPPGIRLQREAKLAQIDAELQRVEGTIALAGGSK